MSDATQVLDGGRFTRLGGWAALALSDTPSNARVVDVSPQASAGVQVLTVASDDATAELRIESVWGEPTDIPGLQARVIALVCTASGCRLFGAPTGDSTLRALPGFSLSAEVKVDTLVGDPGRICAYGEGLWCTESGKWAMVMRPEETGRIAAVSLGAPSVAATTDGRLFVETETSWTSTSLPIRSVVALDTREGTVSALSDDGTWYAAILAPRAAAQCQQSPPLRLAVPSLGEWGRPWLVVADNGVVYQQQFPSYEWCQLSSSPAFMIAQQIVRCSDSTNILAITETGLFSLLGPVACVVR